MLLSQRASSVERQRLSSSMERADLTGRISNLNQTSLKKNIDQTPIRINTKYKINADSVRSSQNNLKGSARNHTALGMRSVVCVNKNLASTS